MDSITRRLVDEWERTVLGIVSVVFLCCLLAWFLPSSAGGGTQPEPSLRPRPSALGDNACAFLDPARQTPPGGDAFAFAYEAPPEPKQPPKDPEHKKDGTKKDETKKTDDTGGGVQGGTSSDPHTQPPEVPPHTCSIRYLGTYESTDGQRLAALVLRDSATGKAQTHFLREGQAHSGVQVDGFDDRTLRVLVPGGKEATVERGGIHTVTQD